MGLSVILTVTLISGLTVGCQDGNSDQIQDSTPISIISSAKECIGGGIAITSEAGSLACCEGLTRISPITADAANNNGIGLFT